MTSMKTETSVPFSGISPSMTFTVWRVCLRPVRDPATQVTTCLQFGPLEDGQVGVRRIGQEAVLSFAPERNEGRGLHVAGDCSGGREEQRRTERHPPASACWWPCRKSWNQRFARTGNPPCPPPGRRSNWRRPRQWREAATRKLRRLVISGPHRSACAREETRFVYLRMPRLIMVSAVRGSLGVGCIQRQFLPDADCRELAGRHREGRRQRYLSALARSTPSLRLWSALPVALAWPTIRN